MRVGTAQLDITPRPGIELVGFAVRPQPSTGVLDPLAVRALYLEDGAERLLWLHADLLAFEEPFVADLRRQVERDFGIPGSRVLVSATHTHSGPPTIHLTGCGAYDPAYVDWLEGRFLDVAGAALAAPEACDLVAVEGTCDLTVDRRQFASAHTDPRVAAVGWRRADGTFKAVLLNYGMHGVCLRGALISADWPGVAAQVVSQSLPGQPLVLVCTGASGNTNPPAVGVSPEQVREWGRAVAESVLPDLRAAPPTMSTRCPASSADGLLRADMIRVPLPLENCTLAEIEAFVAQCRSDAAGFDEFGEKYRLAMDTWQGTMTTRVLRGEPPYTIAELAAIVLGPVVFVAVNAEIFSRFSELVGTDPRRPLYAIGCMGEMIGYLAPAAAYEEGGYEVRWAMLFYNRPCPKSGGLELLAAEARRLVARLGFAQR